MYKKYIKRIIDIIFSLLLIPVVVLIIMICGLFIKLEDGGPIIYTSNRLGKGKKVFKMYKLRSMKVDAPDIRNEDGSTFNAAEDPRLTKVGKFIRKTSLDELPQVFNVLYGNMSFIGPRPGLPDNIKMYDNTTIRRLEVLPGMTGYSQAYYRNSKSAQEIFQYDVYYVDNISIKVDFQIIIKTILIVLGQRNVYSHNNKNYSSNDFGKGYDKQDV